MLLSNGGFCQYENSPAVKNSLFLSYVVKKNIYAILLFFVAGKELQQKEK